MKENHDPESDFCLDRNLSGNTHGINMKFSSHGQLVIVLCQEGIKAILY